MLYIIMCGGDYHTPEPKQFREIKGERIVDRTIRLLRENGVSDISVSINHHEDRFDYLLDQGVELLYKVNNFVHYCLGCGCVWYFINFYHAVFLVMAIF